MTDCTCNRVADNAAGTRRGCLHLKERIFLNFEWTQPFGGHGPTASTACAAPVVERLEQDALTTVERITP